MVAKCANPVCCAPFRYLHLGRVFRIEIRGHSGNESGYGDNCSSRVEHYWLCHVCSTSLTLAVQAGKVVTRPLHPAPRAPGSFAAAGRRRADHPLRRTSAVSFQQNESVVG